MMLLTHPYSISYAAAAPSMASIEVHARQAGRVLGTARWRSEALTGESAMVLTSLRQQRFRRCRLRMSMQPFDGAKPARRTMPAPPLVEGEGDGFVFGVEALQGVIDAFRQGNLVMLSEDGDSEAAVSFMIAPQVRRSCARPRFMSNPFPIAYCTLLSGLRAPLLLRCTSSPSR
eukprot:6201977-Pleurochrysis_carterae.AAC.2